MKLKRVSRSLFYDAAVVVCKTDESLYFFKMVEGVGQSRTAATFFSPGRTSSEELVCPRKVTCVQSRNHFCGLLLGPALSSAFSTAVRLITIIPCK